MSRAVKAEPLGADGAKITRLFGDKVVAFPEDGIEVVTPHVGVPDNSPQALMRAAWAAYYRNHADPPPERWAHVAYAVYDLAEGY